MSRVPRPLVLALLVLSPPLAATPRERDRPLPAFAAGTERVRVDFVVRDKANAILRGLGADDVWVYEDGVRQHVDSLDFVDRGVEPASFLPPLPPAFVAVAFDRLSPAARSFARQALLDYLAHPLPAPSWMGVFSIDRGVRTLQPFTDDRGALRAALDRSLGLAPSSFSGIGERDEVRKAWGGLAMGFGQAHVAAAEFAAEPECRSAEDDVVRRLKILDSRMVEGFESLERDRQGFATTHALLALIGGLKALPGRKAVLLFSEGLAVPADVEASFTSVVAAANEANVSIYGADAGGLRASSAADETRRTLASLQTRLELQQGAGSPSLRGPSTHEDPTSGLALLERNEDALRLDAAGGLGRLANLTGGFAIRDTNDLSPALADMGEELATHYVVSYTPRNQDYDGRFRSIRVEVRRPHGRLQARKGYLGVRTALPVPVLQHEAAALARLERGPRPTALPVRLRGLQFPSEPPLSLVPVMVEVPSRGLRDLTIVVLVRDAARQVVAKMSQRYLRLEPRREGAILFYREARLPAGAYTLEAVAHEGVSDRAGAARAELDVPDSDAAHLRASSLMIVGSAEPLDAALTAAPRPLRYGDVLLYPNLGQPLRRESGGPLAFFVTAWPAAARPDVDARVELRRDGRTVVATPPARLAPDAEGRIQLASSLPIASLAPGTYEVQVSLSDGRHEEVRTALVPIAP